MKLLIADDHTLFRDSLRHYIERADPECKITPAENFSEAFEIMQDDAQHDLVLLDLRMPGMNGLDGLKKMCEAHPDIPVALMSGIAEAADIKQSMEIGAAGYFPKTMSGKEFLAAIKEVVAGSHFFPKDKKTDQFVPSYYDDGETRATKNGKKSNGNISQYKMTPRELDVLGYLVRGASNKEIANELGLKVVTVKLHVSGICRKLNAQNRTQAALIARDHGVE